MRLVEDWNGLLKRGCVVSLLGNTQNPSGHNPGQPALADSAWAEGFTNLLELSCSSELLPINRLCLVLAAALLKQEVRQFRSVPLLHFHLFTLETALLTETSFIQERGMCKVWEELNSCTLEAKSLLLKFLRSLMNMDGSTGFGGLSQVLFFFSFSPEASFQLKLFQDDYSWS